MRSYIVDGMKKESRLAFVPIALGYAMSILQPIVIKYGNITGYTNTDAIKLALAYFLLGSWGVYAYLYARKYHVEISEDTIKRTTLFSHKELNLCELTCYSYKRYSRSALYGFKLQYAKNKMLVYTRFRDEFIELLRSKGTRKIS